MLMESKPEVQKILICLKSREGSRTTRFSNTSVDVQQIMITNARNGKLLQANMRNKIKQAILCGSLLKGFSKGTVHESRKIPVSNLKTLSGKRKIIKGKNRLTRIILWIKRS